MKKIFFTLILVSSIATFKGHADEIKKVASKLNEVTLFFKGAELTHSATATLNKGENEITIEGLSPSIDNNSIKIKSTNGIIINSFEFSIDYLTKNTTEGVTKKLQDSIDICQRQLNKIDVALRINEDLLKLLEANQSIGGTQNGLSVAELIKMMDYYKLKSSELQNEQSDYQEKKKLISANLNKLKNQLASVSRKNDTKAGVLNLKLTAPLATTSNFTISYYTPLSGWTPYHEVSVSGINKPIKIVSKAKIKQTTGLNWNKVKLALSTSAPSKGKIAPLFSTWFLQYQFPQASARNILEEKVSGLMMQNYYAYKESANKAVIRGANTTPNIPPLYVVDEQPMSAEEFATINPDLIKEIQILKDASATAIYGSSAMGGVVLVTLKNSMSDFVSREENQLNMVYNLDLPYSIAGDGKEQSVELQSTETTANFKYYSTPKLDSETFLLAEIADWEKLGLLSGKANVTYDGTYVGETLIDVSSTHKTLNLTLGTDKRVVVKREKLQDFSRTNFLGSDKKQMFAYQITVKNNQNQSISMVLKDQYPISTQKDIEVEIQKETTPATFNNEDVGVLSWEFELNPGETKVFKLVYSVKYPKDKKLNL